jgi:regulatory protein
MAKLFSGFKKKSYFCIAKQAKRIVMKDKIQKGDNLHALLDRARRYCSGVEQCEDAVRQKLVTWGATPGESDVVIAKLIEENYLDDERYACAYCESKILGQHWGRQKVLYQLRQKHIPRAAVDKGMASVSEEDYLGVLRGVAERKSEELADAVSDPFVLRQKVTAFLVTRGFTLAEINRVLDEMQ